MTTNADPEAIAREILRLDADRSAAEPQGDFFDYMVALRKTAPTLAAAYLDLRAQLDESEARRVTARQERDAAVRALRRCVITRFRGLAAVPLRAQLDAVTAQRDELREAAAGFVSRVSNVVPVDSFGHRKTSLQRLRAALEAAR